jgi:hypothetical protein
MKTIKSFLFTLSFFGLLIISCNKEASDIIQKNEISDYTSSLSQLHITLAKSLVEAFTYNSEMKSVAIKECYKMFDGDRDVLLKDLLKKQIGTLKSTSLTFGSILNEYLGEAYSINLKSEPTEDYSNLIVAIDPLIQLYYYKSPMSKDTTSFDGIVVMPVPFNEKTDKILKLFKNNGAETTIRSDVEPVKNYIIISQNERSGQEWSNINTNSRNLKNAITVTDDPNNTIMHSMKITNATFISMNALRQVESWIRGQPEVRINVFYSVKDHLNDKWDLKFKSFLYPENWYYTKWFTSYVKWVGKSMDFPDWSFNEQSFDRKIQWVEEDGQPTETTYTWESTVTVTHDKKTISTKIPASTTQVIIAESYIDYYTSTSGEINWGLIKFTLAF